MKKKGQNVNGLLPFVIAIVGVALIAGIASLVMNEASTSITNTAGGFGNDTIDPTASLGNGTLGLTNVTGNLPLIATIGALAVVALLAIGIFGRRFTS